MTDEGITLRYDPPQGPPRRVRYEARSPEGYTRITEVWTGCDWRAEGSEPVTDIGVEIGQRAVDDVEIVGDETDAETVTGPEQVDR
ncbi:hypothetical protein [Halosimplex pelagicum]|uniref:Uncharacterized protein n=1 Tax=Halosimplex pelagicum TaxID=869886 RepID=A0A7D5P774_9EURY|nr:hypothetical protein [Halosimplex pelagicum]QLH82443.1 hypothetical protein HZS54_12830 [Halosimplex pelagicum]QLH82499.1 hypothetical protein HZS54_13135 [Halosimplex pelagicum]